MPTITPLYEYTHQHGTIAAGALMQYADLIASPGTPSWKPLNGVLQTPEVSLTTATVEDTTIADKSKHYIAGIGEGAETSIELVEYPDDADQLTFIKNAEGDRANKLFKLQYSNGITYQFEAAILGFSRAAKGSEDRNTVTVNLKLSGAPTRVEV